MNIPAGIGIDLSDIQDLRAKLCCRDRGIWPPHSDYLRRIKEDLLSGKLTKAEFKRRSVVLLEMEQPLSKEFREAEYRLMMTGEWTPNDS
jgi:hypothetical protein